MPRFRCICTVHLAAGAVETTTREVIGIEANHERQAAELVVKAAKMRYKDFQAKVTKVTLDSIHRL